MHDVILAVDLGSTWCKAAYLDAQGRTVATGRAYTRDIPSDRHVTLERFWAAFREAVRAASAKLPSGVHPAAIGISTRALFGVCLTAQGKAILPTGNQVLSRHNSPDVQQAYAPELWGDKDPFAYGYAISQAGLIVWLKRTHPDDWQRIWRIGALHDYIVYRMTDAWVTDPTTGPGQATWPAEIVSVTGLSVEAFPRILDPHEVAGPLTAAAAQELGFPAGIPVVVGLHDGAAANLGVRAVGAGDACLTLGTNFVLRAVNGVRLPPPATGYMVTSDSWAWVNNVPSAAPQLDIVAQTLLGTERDVAECHTRLGALANSVAPGAAGFSLSLTGSGQQNEQHQAVLAARQAGHSDGVIYRAILEAIAFGVRNLVQRAQQHGARPQRFAATGGSAQNLSFLSVLAAVLNAPIEIGHPEGGILGAGMVAAVGAGWYATTHEAMMQMSAPGPMVQPPPDAVEFYAAHQTQSGNHTRTIMPQNRAA